jgi:hypothetical protein
MKTENKFFRGFRYYLLFVSFLMIIQFVYYEIQLLMNWNVNAWMMAEKPAYSQNFYLILGYLFFFSVYNIPVCGISGVVLLIKRYKIKLAVLCLVAIVLYYLLLQQMGDSL